MSLKYRDNNGNEVPISGLNGQNGSLVPSVSLYQKGSKLSDTDNWVPGDSGVFTVTFSTPMPDADYDVILGINTPEVTASVAYDKTVSGFKVKVENVSSVTYAGRIELSWQAFKLMTDTVHEADSAHIAQNTANFAPAFSEVTSYAVGDYVTYNNILYRCTTAHTAGTWVAGHFTQVTVGGDFVGQGSAPTLDNGTRIGLDKLDLRKLGLGDVQYNKIYMEVMNTSEVPGTPITGGGQTLYMKLGLIEFAIGPISADATQWSPQTLAYVRINFAGTGYSNWKEL